IYAREAKGRFASLRILAMLVLLGLYYVLPWINWHGRQGLLFDLPARKFHFFSITIWPQDFFYISALLIIAAFALFFFTALAGRLWCGYACPQTVWTEAFMWIENRLEGSRARRMKLDKGPWNARKIRIKATKHTVWLVFSLITGFTFVGYFTPIRELWQHVATFSTGPWETFWILFYGLATWGNAGFLREQVCIYMCPYARFQSVMFDPDTMIISYDEARGEPRGARRKTAAEKKLGDCVDCGICVQVCPTGIDIRKGLQYECIGCAACVDACDEVMAKVDSPKGLIRYTTENALSGKGTHILRPRISVYGAALLAVTAAVFWGLFHLNPVGLDVIRDRLSLFHETNQGLIENVYTLKVLNKDRMAHEFKVNVSGIEGAKMLLDEPKLVVESGGVEDFVVRVQVEPGKLKGERSTEIEFEVESIDPGEEVVSASEEARFLGPTDY
ncbi:MAG: cytochrome c oxidase accessory protein CcoG, partial [Pseudomonadota bacterium]|nr:cytochrome c oxidase accessory protein CcoG [Pseudomonadota bacterium]